MPSAQQNAPSREISVLLEELVQNDQEIGIQVAAYLGDDCVVDAWAGYVDEDKSRPVDAATLFPIFSVIKGVTAIAAHIQAEKKLLDIDAPIASYWPEFGANGKENVTLRHVLTHRAGIPQLPADLTIAQMADWDGMTRTIANLKPLHEPGGKTHYLAMTFGWLVGEAVRRTDPLHRPFEDFIRDEITDPLGADDLYYSVPDDARPRVAMLSGSAYPPPSESSMMRLGIPAGVDLSPIIFNRPDTQKAVSPAVGGYANAKSLARVFSVMANGGRTNGARLLSEERVAAARTPRSRGEEPDPFLGGPARLSIGGFMLGDNKPAVGGRADILYSTGAGGSLAWADTHQHLAVAITHNKMYQGLKLNEDPALRIGNALRAALNARA